MHYSTRQSLHGGRGEGRGSILVRAYGEHLNKRESHSVHTDSIPLPETNSFVIEKLMKFYLQNYKKVVRKNQVSTMAESVLPL